jgi:hypothetical protein
MFFGIRDPGSGMGKNPDPESGINIPDPQHWEKAVEIIYTLLKKTYLTTVFLQQSAPKRFPIHIFVHVHIVTTVIFTFRYLR